MMNPEELDDLLQDFLVESREGLDTMDEDLLVLERDPGAIEAVTRIFRALHTIKGCCGFLELVELGHLAHAGENLLDRLRNRELRPTPPIVECLFQLADRIREWLDRLEADGVSATVEQTELVMALESLASDGESPAGGGVEPEGTPAAASSEAATSSTSGRSADSTIRVDVGLLDTLMNLVGELVLARNQLLQLEEAAGGHGVNVTMQRLNHVTTELQEGVMKTRMQPIGSVWSRMPRLVRDTAQACKKTVNLEMNGRETELDKTILEGIKDPLVHVIRNSIDHGIESPAERAENGKPEAGTVSLRAYHEGGQVTIEIADDGAGIDTERVLARAVERRLVTAEAASSMSEREIQALLFRPGFSTAESVTSVSGRGVGMDVVKTAIEAIGGVVEVQSRRGQGTILRFRIPLTLAIIPALVVTARGDRFAIPQVNLLELVRLEGDDVTSGIEWIGAAPVHRLRGKLLPLCELGTVLGEPREIHGREALNIVVVQAEQQRFGLIVDEVLDTEEIVVKPLGRQLKEQRVHAGATIMGDGRVALILDVAGLAHASGMAVDAAAARAEEDPAEEREGAGEGETQWIVVEADGNRCAISMEHVARLEDLDPDGFEVVEGQAFVQYRGTIMPLVELGRGGRDGEHRQVVVVRSEHGVPVGLRVDAIHDIAVAGAKDRKGERLIVLDGRVVRIVDVAAHVEEALLACPGLVGAVEEENPC